MPTTACLYACLGSALLHGHLGQQRWPTLLHRAGRMVVIQLPIARMSLGASIHRPQHSRQVPNCALDAVAVRNFELGRAEDKSFERSMRLARLAVCHSLLGFLDCQLASQMACSALGLSSVATAGAWRSRAPLGPWPARQRGRIAFPRAPLSGAAFSSAVGGSAGNSIVHADMPVGDAVRLTCEQLGRPFANEVVQALLDNWYSTAGELAALPDETARLLGIPLRLRTAVAQALQASEAAGPDAVVDGALQGPGAATATAGADAARDAAMQGSRSSGSLADSAIAGRPTQQQGSRGETSFPAGTNVASSSPSSSRGSNGRLAIAAQQEAAAAIDPSSLPIEQRRCPLQRRFGNSATQAPRVVRRSRASRYALSVSAPRATHSSCWHCSARCCWVDPCSSCLVAPVST